MVTPPDTVGSKQYYQTPLVYLPNTYQPQDEYSDSMLFNPQNVNTDPHMGESDPEMGEWEYNRLNSSITHSIHTRTLLRKYLMGKYEVHGMSNAVVGVWYICFNRIEKITPDVYEDWMLILHRSKGVSLVLQAVNSNVTNMLYSYADYYGINKNRILLFPKLIKKDYSILLGLADLFLDTRYYNW